MRKSVRSPSNPQSFCGLLLFVFACLTALSLFACGGEPEIQSRPEVIKGKFLNIDPEVKYVGDEDCQLCHSKIYESFKKTGMGRSFYPLTASNIIEDFSQHNHVYDESSNFHYEAISRGGEFFQVEYRLDDQGQRMHELSRKMDYVIGSGNQARTYITVENGFFYQLPLTWYAEKKKWDMSPGFDKVPWRFSREISADCMNCHNSYATYVRYSGNHYTEVPHGISCERCHGPGELHVETRFNTKFPDSTQNAVDKTIVNPRHLPGKLQMEVCFQCHLQPQVAVLKPGQQKDGFRPGMKMTDVRSIFVFADLDPGDLRVAGHGQRFASCECYKKSAGKLTCITCHDPHRPVKTMARDHFNSICIGCHDHSTLSQGRPNVRHEADGDCVKCHMPRGNTSDVGHVNFTDHWIQKVPVPIRDAMQNDIPELEDFYSEQDEQAPLRLGIANLRLFGDSDNFRDPFEKSIATVAMNLETNPKHEEGLYYLAMACASTGRLQEAAKYYETLIQTAPHNADAHLQLAKVFEKLQRPDEAIEACQAALRLLPENAETLTQLGSLYAATNKLQQAEKSFEKALAVQPSYISAHIALGKLLAKSQGSLSDARDHFLYALELEPDNISVLENLGNVAMLSSRPWIAANCFERILTIDAKFIPAYGYLAFIYSSHGKTTEAVSYLKRALKIEPDHARIKAMLRELESPGEGSIN